ENGAIQRLVGSQFHSLPELVHRPYDPAPELLEKLGDLVRNQIFILYESRSRRRDTSAPCLDESGTEAGIIDRPAVARSRPLASHLAIRYRGRAASDPATGIGRRRSAMADYNLAQWCAATSLNGSASA